ncbi:MAG: hypothetical protein ABMA13_19860 [Chthoniobacteraceae bacterium]
MPDHHAPSFLQRHADSKLQIERRILAKWIAGNLVEEGARLFVVSGTTAAAAGEEILQRVDSVHITTNSVPMAWYFIGLVEKGFAAPHVSVSVVGGELRAVTGAIAGKAKPERGATLLISPHGLTAKAITGNRDVDQLKPLVNGHRKVIMPVSWSKLNREAFGVVKHLGHWKRVDCQLVITERPHSSLRLSEEDHRNGIDLLKSVATTMGNRLTIHWLPLKRGR